MEGNNIMFSSKKYWENRYSSGNGSGSGSYGRLALFKAEIINDFIKDKNIKNVIEFGVGDRNNLSLYKIKKYTGYDVSDSVISQVQRKFACDKTKKFKTINNYNGETADLTLSLDVIFHLVENEIFDAYMSRLFDASLHYVIIYSPNKESKRHYGEHVKLRKFTDWVYKHRPKWQLIYSIKNRYPENIYNANRTSFSNFYIFSNAQNESINKRNIFKYNCKYLIIRPFLMLENFFITTFLHKIFYAFYKNCFLEKKR